MIKLLSRSDRLYRAVRRLSDLAKLLDRGLLTRTDAMRGLPLDLYARALLPEPVQFWVHQDLAAVRERIEVMSSYLQLVAPTDAPMIRVGGEGDGGYVMVDDFGPADFFVSLGVGPDVSWDREVARAGSGVHLYDHTIVALPAPVEEAVLYRERVSARPGPGLVTLDECIRRTPDACDLVLKMDIEGSEWGVLAEARSADLERFRQIAVEYHDLLAAAIDPARYSVVIAALARVWETHQPVHLHANNCANFQVLANVPVPDVVEVTYLRRSSYVFAARSPSPGEELARANDESFPAIAMTFPVPNPPRPVAASSVETSVLR